jgi:hypothetical protein
MTYGPEAGKTTKEETKALRMFERKIERKIYRPIEEVTWRRVRTNKDIKNILQRTGIVKFIESLRLRCYGHVKRM